MFLVTDLALFRPNQLVITLVVTIVKFSRPNVFVLRVIVEAYPEEHPEDARPPFTFKDT